MRAPNHPVINAAASLCHILEIAFFVAVALYITLMFSLSTIAPPLYCTVACRTGCVQLRSEWDQLDCDRKCIRICYNETASG
jgi:hypothetical protein